MKQIYYVIQTLLRGRGSNIIKIISLGLSLTMSILLFSRVAYEQSFDTCYKDYDNLYQIWSVFTVKGEKYPPQEQNCGPVAGAILENFPEQVEAATSTCYWKNSPLYNGNIRFDEKKIVADSLFFQTMGIEVLSGNPVKDLQQPDVIFLSDRFAKKIFGGEDPVGKTINYNHEKDFMVKGTYKALPANATVNPEAVISMPTLWNEGSGGNYSWQGGDSYPEYIRFRSGADKSVVNARIDAMIEKYRPEESKTKYGYTAFVKPIRDTYRNYESVKRMRNIMSVLGFAILFIAALNYVLISISSLTYRAKAVGVHKCNGASGGKIFGMFLLETGIIIVAALLLMALVLLNFREFFEDTAAAKLSLLLAPERIWVPLTVIGVLFIVGGVLPGRLFARIPVSQVFRRYTEGKKGWKRPLLFIQFAGVAFISGLMCVVMAQYQYVLNKDMGYNPQRLALANAYWNKEKECDAAFQFFKGLPYVEAVTSANNTPISGYSGSMIRDESGNALFSTRACYYMREDYPAMMGMTFKTGRMARTEDEVIVNETFADMMHWGNDAVGRTVDVDGTAQMKVVGVLKDFQIEDFTADKMPFVARYNKYFVGTIHVRLKEPFVRNLQQLNKDVADAFHNQTIDFIGYEKKITDSYNSVRVFRNATLMAAITMFFVMLMGLIGYTADEVRRRSKEIAIRKVNGAGIRSIIWLFARLYLTLLVATAAITFPLIHMVLQLWKQMYTVFFHDGLLYWGSIFGGITLLTAITIIFKILKIARLNPAEVIKNE